MLRSSQLSISFFFFFNDTATTEIYTLSLHDALPISLQNDLTRRESLLGKLSTSMALTRLTWDCHELQDQLTAATEGNQRSEEHTSELQSPCNLVCRLLLEKKKKTIS